MSAMRQPLEVFVKRIAILGRSSRCDPPAAGTNLYSAWTAAVAEPPRTTRWAVRSEEHTSELQSRLHLVCRLLLEKKKNIQDYYMEDDHQPSHIHTYHPTKPQLQIVRP